MAITARFALALLDFEQSRGRVLVDVAAWPIRSYLARLSASINVSWAKSRAEHALVLSGEPFGRVTDRTVEAAFPERLTAAVVRHGYAEGRDSPGWATRTVSAETDRHRALELLRLLHLIGSCVSHYRIDSKTACGRP